MEWMKGKREREERKQIGERTLAFIAFFLGVLCFLMVLAVLGRREASSETVLTAFEAANFSKINCHIYREGYLDDWFYLEEEKEALLKELYGQWKPEHGTLSLDLLVREEQAGECEIRRENYLRADLEILQDISVKEALKEHSRFSEFTDRTGMGGTVYLELEGYIPGELSREEQRILAEALLEKMGAKQVNHVDEDTLYTIYAYAEGAGETKPLPEGEVNLNLAVSYDGVRDETVFHLGCPILASDW
ncbi:MAG: hypothetical protein HFI63_02855 [Lachnospiraceae bacterium]|nr:hypothetical protein [Lachnospiraceae bacterium]